MFKNYNMIFTNSLTMRFLHHIIENNKFIIGAD